MKYFYEKTSEADFKIGYRVKKNIYSKTKNGTKIEVIQNSALGKLFILNGAVHFAENYEFIFSELIAHSIMFSHPKPEKVLLISDFDRGIIKEVIKHKNVNEVYLISNKKELQETFEENFPNLKGSNSKIIFDNPKEYIKNFQNFFDVVIIDSNVKDKTFLKHVFNSLTKEGMVSITNGFFKEPSAIQKEFKTMKSIFKYETFLKSSFNLQFLSSLGIQICSKKIDVSEITLRILNTRFKQFEEARGLKYYSPEIHLSSMVIPKFYKI